jgi:hypothetical protein
LEGIFGKRKKARMDGDFTKRELIKHLARKQ